MSHPVAPSPLRKTLTTQFPIVVLDEGAGAFALVQNPVDARIGDRVDVQGPNAQLQGVWVEDVEEHGLVPASSELMEIFGALDAEAFYGTVYEAFGENFMTMTAKLYFVCVDRYEENAQGNVTNTWA